MCALTALPVLQLARLGDAVSAVEERAGPALGRRAVGGAGVGVECVSEHERELGNGGGGAGADGGGELVGEQGGGGGGGGSAGGGG